MQGIKHTIRRLTETSLCDGVNCTRGRCATNLLNKFELIIIINGYSTECSGLQIQPDD